MPNTTYPTNLDVTILPDHLQFGPARLFVGTTPPATGTPPSVVELTDGVPDSGYFLGMTQGPSVASWQPQYLESRAEGIQAATHVVGISAGLQLQVALKEVQTIALQAAMPTADVHTGADIVSFGNESGLDVPTSSILLVVARPMTDPVEYVTFMLYKAYNASPVDLSFGKRQSTLIAVTFRGLADLDRDAGDLVGQLVLPQDSVS